MITPCITEETLADFAAGRLPPKQRSAIEGHMAACDDCLDMLTLSMGVVRGGDAGGVDPVPETVTREAVRLVLERQAQNRRTLAQRLDGFTRRVRDRVVEALSPMFTGAPAPVPIRGSKQQITEDLVRLQKTFPDLDTQIEIEKIGQGRAHIRVRLAGSYRKEKGIRVTLERDEREISSQLIGGSYALFEGVAFGRYRMRFSRNGENLGEYAFELKESVNG